MHPIAKPDIIIADHGPLIHLASSGLLGLLHEVGRSVRLVDVTVQVAERSLSEGSGTGIAAWIAAGARPENNAPVTVTETEMGRIMRIAQTADPQFQAPNAVEAAVIEWLATTVQEVEHPTIILHESGRIPGIVANQAVEVRIEVVTTRAFLEMVGILSRSPGG